MKLRIWIVAALAGTMIAAGGANAEIMQGRVVGSDPDEQIVEIERENPRNGLTEKLWVRFDDTTELAGVEAFREIMSGDELMIDANVRAGQWEAQSAVLIESAAGNLPDNEANQYTAPDNARHLYNSGSATRY